MPISMRELLGRQAISGELISFRNALANHPVAHAGSLRTARARLLELADGNGFARGCRRQGSVKIDFGVGEKDVGLALPNWVPVAGATRLVRDAKGVARLAADFAGETRTAEGILEVSKVTHEDFPFKPWHTYYDWNFFVRPDTQYRHLLSASNVNDKDGLLECEWDTGFLPSWAWPQEGERIWLVGRWIYDCGHPGKHGHPAEIHPPKAVASFRPGAVKLPGNARPTRVTTAVLFIGRSGGYWKQPINDQNYAFDLHLPPRPDAKAEPKWTIEPKTGRLPVQPTVTPFPERNPRALRVVIPLKGVSPHPESYGALISGGWSDPRGVQAAKVKRFRVTVEEILMDANLDPSTIVDPIGRDDWYVYVGVNGRWKVFKDLSGSSHALDYTVELDLDPKDRIHVTACGFEADEIHDLMGHNTGLSWASVVDREKGGANARKIRSGFLSLGLRLDSGIENEALGIVSQSEPARAIRTLRVSSKKDYRLRYAIREI